MRYKYYTTQTPIRSIERVADYMSEPQNGWELLSVTSSSSISPDFVILTFRRPDSWPANPDAAIVERYSFTPLHLMLLLHYHIGEAHPSPNAPAVVEFTEQLIRRGLIMANRDSGSGYSTTDVGKELIDRLRHPKI